MDSEDNAPPKVPVVVTIVCDLEAHGRLRVETMERTSIAGVPLWLGHSTKRRGVHMFRVNEGVKVTSLWGDNLASASPRKIVTDDGEIDREAFEGLRENADIKCSKCDDSIRFRYKWELEALLDAFAQAGQSEVSIATLRRAREALRPGRDTSA